MSVNTHNVLKCNCQGIGFNFDWVINQELYCYYGIECFSLNYRNIVLDHMKRTNSSSAMDSRTVLKPCALNVAADRVSKGLDIVLNHWMMPSCGLSAEMLRGRLTELEQIISTAWELLLSTKDRHNVAYSWSEKLRSSNLEKVLIENHEIDEILADLATLNVNDFDLTILSSVSVCFK